MIFNIKIIDWTIYGKPENNFTNKVLLPNYILKKLSNDEYTRYPLVFRLYKKNKYTYIGNVEFGDTKYIVVPYNILNRLNVSYQESIYIRNLILPTGKYIKFKPNNTNYVNNNIKSLLENKLKSYMVLNKDDIIEIENTEFTIVELKDVLGKSVDGINIVNVDIDVDFEELNNSVLPIETSNSVLPIELPIELPEKIELSDYEKQMQELQKSDEEDNTFKPFSGNGYKLGNF